VSSVGASARTHPASFVREHLTEVDAERDVAGPVGIGGEMADAVAGGSSAGESGGTVPEAANSCELPRPGNLGAFYVTNRSLYDRACLSAFLTVVAKPVAPPAIRLRPTSAHPAPAFTDPLLRLEPLQPQPNPARASANRRALRLGCKGDPSLLRV
jgi:hypothetical protein